MYFVTYANENYENALPRICQQAEALEVFEKIIAYRTSDLGPEFLDKHANFLAQNKRGGGYWLWKPYVIYKTLCEMPENAPLVYCDAGCHLLTSGKARFLEYIDMIKSHPTHMLAMNYPEYAERQWSKADLLHHLNFTSQEQLDSRHCVGGIQFMLNTHENREFARQIYEIAESQNYHFVDDSPSNIPNDPMFVEHRHDQSIFSILCKKRGVLTIPNEIECGREITEQNAKFPIHARRDRK